MREYSLELNSLIFFAFFFFFFQFPLFIKIYFLHWNIYKLNKRLYVKLFLYYNGLTFLTSFICSSYLISFNSLTLYITGQRITMNILFCNARSIILDLHEWFSSLFHKILECEIFSRRMGIIKGITKEKFQDKEGE